MQEYPKCLYNSDNVTASALNADDEKLLAKEGFYPLGEAPKKRTKKAEETEE